MCFAKVPLISPMQHPCLAKGPRSGLTCEQLLEAHIVCTGQRVGVGRALDAHRAVGEDSDVDAVRLPGRVAGLLHQRDPPIHHSCRCIQV